MIYKKAALKPDEKVCLELRGLYEQYGYKKYKMSKFEEYSLYVENKDFLGTDKVITFTDLDGRLLALKPDVTLSIIKNTNATEAESEKLYYQENVYRENRESHTFTEINQMGLECLGDVDNYTITEVIALAAESLNTVSENYILELAHMSFVVELLESLQVSRNTQIEFLKQIRIIGRHFAFPFFNLEFLIQFHFGFTGLKPFFGVIRFVFHEDMKQCTNQ